MIRHLGMVKVLYNSLEQMVRSQSARATTSSGKSNSASLPLLYSVTATSGFDFSL